MLYGSQEGLTPLPGKCCRIPIKGPTLTTEEPDLIIQYDLEFTVASTVREAKRLLGQQAFHLLIIGLDYLKNIHQADWLADIRRVSFIPLIVLSSAPDQDINNMVRLGADMCISGKPPISAIANHAYAQLRRYTEYNRPLAKIRYSGKIGA